MLGVCTYYRSIYNAATTADSYLDDIKGRRSRWMLGSIVVALVVWLVGSLLVYGLGSLTAWVRRGFASEH